MPSVYFHQEDLTFILPDENKVIQWIEDVVSGHNHVIHELNIIFCSDEYLHNINTSYLDHDTYTDIITFDQSDNHDDLEGDIFISIPRIRENAKQFDVLFEDELHRVIIHGVLHLMGYKDKTVQEIRQMREKEEACLSLRLFKSRY